MSNCLIFYERSDHKLTAYINDENGNALGGAEVEVTVIDTPNRDEVGGASWPLDMVQQPAVPADKTVLPGGDVLVDRSIPYEVTLPASLTIVREQDYICVFEIVYQNRQLYVEKLLKGEIKT